MTKLQQKRFKDLLQKKREEAFLQFERDNQRESALEKSATADIADKATLDETAELLLQQEEHFRLLLREIDRALSKIQEGTFGLCERCEKPISKRRLGALPTARLCIECKQEEEKISSPRAEPRRQGPLSSEFLQQDAGSGEKVDPAEKSFGEEDDLIDML